MGPHRYPFARLAPANIEEDLPILADKELGAQMMPRVSSGF
jgi:hypothetical protein